MNKRSTCCGATYTTKGKVTKYAICDKCGQATNLTPTHEERLHKAVDLFDEITDLASEIKHITIDGDVWDLAAKIMEQSEQGNLLCDISEQPTESSEENGTTKRRDNG